MKAPAHLEPQLLLPHNVGGGWHQRRQPVVQRDEHVGVLRATGGGTVQCGAARLRAQGGSVATDAAQQGRTQQGGNGLQAQQGSAARARRRPGTRNARRPAHLCGVRHLPLRERPPLPVADLRAAAGSTASTGMPALVGASPSNLPPNSGRRNDGAGCPHPSREDGLRAPCVRAHLHALVQGLAHQRHAQRRQAGRLLRLGRLHTTASACNALMLRRATQEPPARDALKRSTRPAAKRARRTLLHSTHKPSRLSPLTPPPPPNSSRQTHTPPRTAPAPGRRPTGPAAPGWARPSQTPARAASFPPASAGRPPPPRPA